MEPIKFDYGRLCCWEWNMEIVASNGMEYRNEIWNIEFTEMEYENRNLDTVYIRV